MRRKAINTTPATELIRSSLDSRGMTQKELSELTGIPAVSINDILANRRSISPKSIVRISIVLGLNAIELGRMQSDYEIMQVLNPLIDKIKNDE